MALSEGKKKHRWPSVAITATYRHLLEGVRTLGQAYSAYDDRNTQYNVLSTTNTVINTIIQ
jgi:hypothetical protein